MLPFLICIAALTILVLAIFFGRSGLARQAKEILLGLVAEAESLFGEGTGSIKFSAVLARLYAAMPSFFRFFFSKERISAWIEEALLSMKQCLSEAEDNDL